MEAYLRVLVKMLMVGLTTNIINAGTAVKEGSYLGLLDQERKRSRMLNKLSFLAETQQY